ncbi:hypothetical protein ART_1087 [Arthrobacter sp. PAMC 25486]|uniref:DoxX family protein n=1 Tax=Arthrobacter sp. PAMC 25486 TaxID=1494608 RepID=UPI00053607A9|nr:hypothetical protein [Arthrobacter sp. PAMC 25486]AIY00686.1 hypothetical protein ART_1087 [Arthrobacter sp. PAMC 25486]
MRSLTTMTRTVGRLVLCGFLIRAGTGHLGKHRKDFQEQVPEWLPTSKDTVVQAACGIEIALDAALLTATQHKARVGRATALFFALIFPGNINQFVTKTPAFGLDTNRKRAIRRLFQPVLFVLALWSTRSVPKA